MFLCPSDQLPDNNRSGSTNYFASAGTGPAVAQPPDGVKEPKPNGMFFQISSVRFAMVSDGLSRTIAAHASFRGTPDPAQRTPARVYAQLLSTNLPTDVPDDAGLAQFRQRGPIGTDRGACWMDGVFLQSLLLGRLTPNNAALDAAYRDFAGGVSGPRSGHPGGVNTLMGDGSVHFVSNFVDRALWQAMGTIAGNDGQNF